MADEKLSIKEEMQMEREGEKAFKAGKKLSDNPYKRNTQRWGYWREGWLLGKEKKKDPEYWGWVKEEIDRACEKDD